MCGVNYSSRGIHDPQAFTLPTDYVIISTPHPSAVLILVLLPRQQSSTYSDCLKTPDQNIIIFPLRFPFVVGSVQFHNAGLSDAQCFLSVLLFRVIYNERAGLGKQNVLSQKDHMTPS